MPSARAAAIVEVVRRLSSGDLSARVEPLPDEADDIATLASAVNELGEAMFAREQLYMLTQQVAAANLQRLNETSGEIGKARDADRERFAETIKQMALPVIEVWERVLVVPVVGVMDTQRASELTVNLLAKITSHNARFAIIDLTSIEVVDTGTAEHLLRMVRAARIVGAQSMLSGISANVAQTIVSLGIDLGQIRTFGTLRQALRVCIMRSSA